MAGGISSENINPVSLAAEVLVNGPEGTGRQSFGDLVAQVAGTEPFAGRLPEAGVIPDLQVQIDAAGAVSAGLRTDLTSLTGNVGQQGQDIQALQSTALAATPSFNTTAAALASSSVAIGGLFSVPVRANGIEYRVYRKDAGPVAALQYEVPMPSALAEKASLDALAKAVGASYGVATAAGLVALSPSIGQTAVTADNGHLHRWTGSVWLDTGGSPADIKVGFSDGIVKAVTSKTLWGGPNVSLISRDEAGKILLQMHDYSIRQVVERAQDLGLLPPDVLHLNPSRSPGLFAGDPQVMLWGLNPAGEFDAVRPSQRFADMIAARLPNSNPYDPVASKLFPSLDLSFVGDSMTTGNWVNVVASLLGGRATVVQQKGGFTSPGMEVVCGIAPLTIGAVAGGSVPADGSPVAVGSKSTNILSSGGSFGGTARGYFASTGIGNTCVLTSDSAGNWTINREIAGAAIPVPDGTTFILHPTLGTSSIPATLPPRGRVRVLRLGRNGVKGTHAARMAIRDSILRHIDHADVRQMHAVVISIYNQFRATEPSGTAAYEAIMETNRLVQEAVGGQIYLDMRKAAVLTAVEEMGLTPDADDLAARAADCIPDRFFSDSTHMTAAFQAQFEGPFVARALMARGY
ncbi:hypothetical protein M3484_05080 [Pseudomonas sp. GX19020]|uniref:hypothetical protein n=1 Tax=Pseudomonas sp. GX19020 TaxID=2942277 RepID=UPI0020184DCF|nr:hypothetical protein [Pseudomonas sp. GX19020]MCL4065935.1 hypothetical protein [Pseudomonas sp. GX19020]